MARSKKAIIYIRLALADGLLLQIQNITDLCLLWKKLKTLYKSKEFSSNFLICKELFETIFSKINNFIKNLFINILFSHLQHASVLNPKLEFASDAGESHADYLRFLSSPQSSSRLRRIDQRNGITIN